MRKLVVALVVLGCGAGAASYFASGGGDRVQARPNAQANAASFVRFGPPSAVFAASRVLTKTRKATSAAARRHEPPLQSSGLAPALLYRRYVAVLPGGHRVHFTWNYVRLSHTCIVPVAPTFPVHMEPLPIGTGCRKFGFGATGS